MALPETGAMEDAAFLIEFSRERQMNDAEFAELIGLALLKTGGAMSSNVYRGRLHDLLMKIDHRKTAEARLPESTHNPETGEKL